MTNTQQEENKPQSRVVDSEVVRQKAIAPVARIEIDAAEAGDTTPVGEGAEETQRAAQLKQGIALCLSGGGYRAMLFHVGTLWRLNELGYLPMLSRVSSVSGGSITAGVLALKWNKLGFTQGDLRVATRFNEEVVLPVRRLADRTIDIGSVLGGLFLRGTVSTYIASAYARKLFGDHSLRDFPAPGSGPDFVINASNLQSGVLWQFSRDFAGDYRVGWLRNPDVSVARAVAASSAFPPFLSPATFTFNERKERFRPGPASDLNMRPYTTNALLVDGGVYDNLGLETAWKYYDTVLVSDGGGKMPPQERPGRDWFRQFLRIRDMTDNQVRGLRKRQLIASYMANETDETHRSGAFWSIRTNISEYQLPDTLECPPKQTEKLASIGTRLGHLDSTTQERLINWGYAICDAAMRRYVIAGSTSPPQFPYPKSKVG